MLAADSAPDRPGASVGRGRRDPSSAILDCINTSDAMVSDVSSVVSDYLFSGKPFAMIAVPAEPAAFVAEFPVARASYVVRGDLADLGPRLAEMLGDDPLAGDRAGSGPTTWRLPGERLRVRLRRRRPGGDRGPAGDGREERVGNEPRAAGSAPADG